MAKKDSAPRTLEIRNRKASRDYFVGETFEAGMVLTGTEIKSLRAGRAQINNINNHKPARPRKLLLHKKEILKLKSATDSGGAAIIPLKIYLKKSLAKVLIAVCKGKKLYDKREDIKRNEAMREARRAMSARR